MTDPIKAAILSLNYSPEPTGIAPYTTSLARHLSTAGKRVTAITGFPHYPQWKRNPDDRGWRRRDLDQGVHLRRLTHYVPNPPRGSRRLVSEITFGLHQVRVGWNRPSVTVFVSPALFSSALCMARSRTFSRSKRVVWVQDLYSQGMAETGEGKGLAVRVAAGVEGWLLRNADAVVAIHPAMAERIATDLKVDPERIHVVPNWSHITVEPVDRASVRARHGWAEDDFIVLHAGNIGKKQGLSNVVEAAKLAEASESKVRFVLLGDGADRARLEQEAGDCSRLTFMDPLPGDDFTAALQAADALLVNELPGVREMAVPSKLTSYFAARRPVIAATDPTGIVASIMSDAHAGPIVQSGEPDLLLAAAEDLSDDATFADHASEAGYAYFQENLSEAGAMQSWDSILKAVTRA
ncbi:glycosyltransferase family 4 protein [Demequina zhanjiangensis]|uniref:Glycosyltransferase family 4 protein n=1 Tax=Demequina zhanjiangensis TaxID=3051659 RepID=A0ABT8FYY6_9MICO|nr:glycosyltransferase family 4 protein [Demequina sp. SYSU T00b26]MDN4472023.1 glycosyltransferase family 4 protein [Demequina sp. SYSU T00b26]